MPHLVAFLDLTDDLAGGRVDGRKRLTTNGVHPFIVDENLQETIKPMLRTCTLIQALVRASAKQQTLISQYYIDPLTLL